MDCRATKVKGMFREGGLRGGAGRSPPNHAMPSGLCGCGIWGANLWGPNLPRALLGNNVARKRHASWGIHFAISPQESSHDRLQALWICHSRQSFSRIGVMS